MSCWPCRRRRLAGLHSGAAGTRTCVLLLSRLDSDQLETIGWPEFVDLGPCHGGATPAEQQAAAVVFTRNYGEAGALEWYGLGRPVFSGHNALELGGRQLRAHAR